VLAVGRCDRVLEPLRATVAEEPLHEGLAARLMLALAGCGQQAAALALFEPVPGRYAMHDLLRLYTGELVRAAESPARRRAATGRLADHYQRRAEAAADLLYPHLLTIPRAGTAVPARNDGFADEAQALAWLDVERPNLVATVVHLQAHGHHRAAWQLAEAVHGYFRLRMYAVDWQATAEAALRAADTDPGADPRARALVRISLGSMHDFHARFEQAEHLYLGALELAQRTGWT
jgi:hypothetical protein